MKAVFDIKDLLLCHVSVPAGYPQSQTHVGVSTVKDGVLLTSTPYPSRRLPKYKAYLRALISKLTFKRVCKGYRGEAYENPCLYVSSDKPFNSFKLVCDKPLMDTPDTLYYGQPAYNSDPDLYVEGNMIYILNRSYYRKSLDNKDIEIRLYLIKGELADKHFKLIGIDLFKNTCDPFVSPCLTMFDNKYVLFYILSGSYNDGCSFEGITYVAAESIDDLKNAEDWRNIHIDCDGLLLWHMSVFQYQGKLYAIIACVKKGFPKMCYQMLGEFNRDLSRLKIFKKPLVAIPSYRGAAYVDKDGIFHLYTTTDANGWKGGSSVDGREILLASMPFNELIFLMNQ